MKTVQLKSISEKISTFSKFGDAGNGGITRYSLSKEDLQARSEFIKRMEAIGCEITYDDFANIYATLKGNSDIPLKRIVTGSHCDSVKNGGNYDGILGVLSAMEVLETIYHEKIPHKHDITAMIWTNEEGSLYPPALMCSGAVCNKYLPSNIQPLFSEEKMLSSRSVLNSNITFEEALSKSGFKGDKKNRLSPDNTLAFFELHIEQGPILEDNKKSIGVVTCVLGMCNYRIYIKGQADHAGTIPMNCRKDALLTASHVILDIHRKLDQLDSKLVYTTGELSIHPNVHTVIPDYIEISLDARHEDPLVIKQVEEVLLNLDKNVLGCEVEAKLQWKRDTVYFDKQLVKYVEESCNDLQYSYQKINSGAGHDAQYVSYVVPTTMIFVPSKDGHSHCEIEHTSNIDCQKGASVLLNAILKCDNC